MSTIIPENFRFGYACINMELRTKKIFMSRTCRLKTLQEKGFDYVKSLAIQNCKDIITILKWNVENGIYFMRLSSEIFPFASHPIHGYDISFADEILKKIGDYTKENKIRLTMHPGQYNVLSSPKEEFIKNTINDLKVHCDILDKMGLDQHSVMIIHGGGIYGDKQKSLLRLKENIKLLEARIINRLVLENCEMAYTVEDLLPISEELQIPIVIDFHHDSINESSNPIDFYFNDVFKVWNKRNIKPKVHISNSVPGVLKTDSKTIRRKHSDYIQFLHDSLLTIDFPIDIMLECKMKEKALIQLCKKIEF